MNKPAVSLDLAVGYITSAPTAPAARGSHQYIGIVQTPTGRYNDYPIGPSSVDGWDLPFLVNPLREGKAIFGVIVNGEIQWQYSEMPKTGNCSGVGLSAPGAAASILVAALATATPDQLRYIRQLLEGA